MKAIAFDLGDTLVEYEGLPLSWEQHYPEALAQLAAFFGTPPSEADLAHGCAVLRRYNTRLNPREHEVAFAAILSELRPDLGASAARNELAAATAFFRIFRQRLRCFADTKAALARLRGQGWRIGVFTDVPYGMPRELVLEDVMTTGLTPAFDVLLTSRDAGFRKPSAQTLRLLAEKLGCSAEEMAYVGNEKKDIDAARAFGCEAVLLDRPGLSPAWQQQRTIRSLAEL